MSLTRRIFRQSFPFIGWCFAKYIKLVISTGQWTIEHHPETEKILNGDKAAIPIFWHGRLMMMPVAKPHKLPMYVIVSKNAIGDLAEKITQYFNILLIRGSSRNPKKPQKDKGGSAALKQIYKFLEEDKCVAFTPDGPKGPYMKAKAGAILAAKQSGAPLLPVSFSCEKGKALKSWDRFLVASLFSKGLISSAAPIYLDDNMSEEQIKKDISSTENILRDLTIFCDQKMKRIP